MANRFAKTSSIRTCSADRVLSFADEAVGFLVLSEWVAPWLSANTAATTEWAWPNSSGKNRWAPGIAELLSGLGHDVEERAPSLAADPAAVMATIVAANTA